MIAWLMRTDIAIRQIEKLSWDWILMDCTGGKCYGLLAVSSRPVARRLSLALLGSRLPLILPFLLPLPLSQTHRFCFALGLLHLILALSLIGVHDTRTKRAALQNGCVHAGGLRPT